MTELDPEREATGQREREVRFFDTFVAEQGEYDVLSEGAYRRLLEWFGTLVQPKPGERCIDLGCGTGAFTKRLRPHRLDLVGMDISNVSVDAANRNALGESYCCGDITRTGLPEASWDIVVYSGVLHHFETAAERASVLAEGYRILAPGGRLFAFDPNAHSPSMFLYRDPRSPLYSQAGKTENEVLLRRDELARQLRDAGFGEVTVRGVSGITFRFVEGRLARRLLPLYNAYEQAIRLSPLEPWLGTFLVSYAQKPGRR